MFHLELRHFPKRLHRYNLSGPEIGAIVLPWVQEKAVEIGENKWLPQQATIAIFEGPQVPVQDISMDRGWRAVQRESRDVTAQVLAEAREHVAAGGSGAPGSGAGGFADTASAAARTTAGASAGVGGDPLALAMQLGALLGPEAARLLEIWQSVRGREPGLPPSEALELAERELAQEHSG